MQLELINLELTNLMWKWNWLIGIEWNWKIGIDPMSAVHSNIQYHTNENFVRKKPYEAEAINHNEERVNLIS